MKIRIGIDVGKKGGIVAIRTNEQTSEKIILTTKTPLVNDEIDLAELQKILLEFISGGTDTLVAIEAVSSIYGSTAKSNFQFGRSLGLVEGLVAGMSIPFLKIHAKKWQKLYFEGVPETVKSDGKTDTKGMALCATKRLYPKVNLLASERSTVPHDGIVDALGIAHYINKNH